MEPRLKLLKHRDQFRALQIILGNMCNNRRNVPANGRKNQLALVLESTQTMTDQRHSLQDEMQGVSHLRDLLYASFGAETLEDGIDHPAEDIIGGAIRGANGARMLGWLSIVCLDPEHPTFSASILRCLGRQVHLGTESWRTELVQKALRVDDPEIRDAALQAAESWGGLSMRDILKIQVKTEPLRWLRSYMQDVIDDLKKETVIGADDLTD